MPCFTGIRKVPSPVEEAPVTSVLSSGVSMRMVAAGTTSPVFLSMIFPEIVPMAVCAWMDVIRADSNKKNIVFFISFLKRVENKLRTVATKIEIKPADFKRNR